MYYQRIIKALFFSNFFYGICTVALAIETAYQQALPVGNISFYILLFCLSTYYYTVAYTHQQNSPSIHANDRTNWYYTNQAIIKYSQIGLLVIAVFSFFNLITYANFSLEYIELKTWLIMLLFPLLALLYYGTEIPGKGFVSLRKFGLFKPFLIGLIWAGTVSILPLLYYDTTHSSNSIFTLTTLFLLLKNWFYISVLCILFDIKDYASDYNFQLKTFIVRLGLRKTLSLVILPMAFIGWMFFFSIAIINHFPPLRIVFNSIPFILLIIVSITMYQRKSILYYLAIIDGLMLVKAIFGITGMILIK
jgi:hypothetical protein